MEEAEGGRTAEWKEAEAMTYKEGQKVICAECGEQWEYPVEDYVVVGAVGIASLSDEDCCHCDAEHTVMKNKDGTFDVEPA